MDNRPIGVFDSGLGGLTGVRELRKRLPHEDIIYFGDTGRVPYGSRSPETILQYARQDVAFLLSKNVKCIMAACGTVSSTYPAAEAAQLPVPYLGVVDAAAREAAFVTRNRRIGVIGTAATIRSRSYEKLLRQLVPGVEITARACPLFVPLVEAGYVDHSEAGKQQITKLVIAQYLTEVREAGVDTLILGCTHYPLLKSMIGEFMGPGVTLVDPAMTAAHHLERMLAERGLRYTPDPGEKTATIGGNAATNAGGPNAFKYGSTRDNVLSVRAVLPSGEVVQLGCDVRKCNDGYNLMQLLLGSEGTLAVITELKLKLCPAVKAQMGFILPFDSLESCLSAAGRLANSGLSPETLEFMDDDMIAFSSSVSGSAVFPAEMGGEHVGAVLYTNFAGESDEELEARRAKWVCPEPKIKTGYLARYAKMVSSADRGAILE